MKKLLSLILAVTMLLTLAACGGPVDSDPTTEPSTVPTTEPTTKPATEPTTEPTTAPTEVPTEPAVQATSYTYLYEGMMGEETAQIDLYADGTCQFFLPGNEMINDVYAGTYTREGNTVSIVGFTNVDPESPYATPGLWEWIVDGNATIAVEDATLTFAPAAAAVDVVGSYTYTFEGMMGEETAQIDLAADGTCQFFLPDHAMIKDVYAGTYTANGTTISITGLTNVDPESPYATPGLWDWIVDGNATVTVDVDAKTFVPAGAEVGPGEGGSAGPNEGGGKVDELKNVPYASTSEAQVCDIHLPAEGENWPVIVLVHGGGFMFGDQSMDVILPVIDKALENGYAVVSVDYRKATEAVFPAALADVKAAVRFVKAHAMDYGWNPEKIAVWGESAGAYLSLMTALTPNVAELNGDVTDYGVIDSEVTALVSFYAPVEFYTLYTEAGKPDSAASSFESKFLGQDIMADKDATYKTYWETYKDQTPTDLMAWIQAGDADSRVPHTQSVNFADRLKNYISEEQIAYSIIEGADHEDDLFYTDENLDAIFAWLDSFMKG